MTTSPYTDVLQRILNNQNGLESDGSGKCTIGSSFRIALKEVQLGRKTSHWMWYIFPTLKGTRTTKHPELELPNFDACKAYLAHKDLRERLLVMTAACTTQLRAGVPGSTLFGKQHKYDFPKFHEVTTCFLLAAREVGDSEAIQVMEEAVALLGGLHNATVGLITNGPVTAAAAEEETVSAATPEPEDDRQRKHSEQVTVCHLGDVALYSLYLPEPVNEAAAPPPTVAFHFVIDNSGSMGVLTRDCIRIFSNLLSISGVEIAPGSLTVFGETAHVLANRIRQPTDMTSASLPSQGMTNITAGIETCVDVITRTTSAPDTVHIMVYLSDGAHNHGPVLDDHRIAKMRQQLQDRLIRLSVIVVGIANNDTSLGMKVKNGLENVVVGGLENVYFAKGASDMRPVLEELTAGCSKTFHGGVAVQVNVDNGLFLENMETQIKPLVRYGTTLNIPVRRTLATADPVLRLNGQPVVAEVVPFQECHMHAVIDAMLPPLRRIRVARGVTAIQDHVALLESTLNAAEEMIRATTKKKSSVTTVDDIGKEALPAAVRLAIHKAAKQAQGIFAQQRNELRQLCATLSDSSEVQAAFLTGANRKYATKALVRADAVDTSTDDIWKETVALLPMLDAALARDEERARKRSASTHVPSSMMSLQTAHETYSDWCRVVRDCPGDVELSNVYSFLVGFGFVGVPCTFSENNAVQMDPFQTQCVHVEPTMVDTATISLALQANRAPKGPAGKPLDSILILVDPHCPETSLLLMRKSTVYKLHASVTLCKNLYMFHYDQTFSMHAHALQEAAYQYGTTKSTAYLSLCIRILYSLRKYVGEDGRMPEKYSAVFQKWWVDGQPLLRGLEADCNHPAMLPAILGIMMEAPPNLDEYHYPMMNYLNEILARTLRIYMIGIGAASGASTKTIARGVMKKWLRVADDTCPYPNPDIMTAEPPRTTVREACIAYLPPEGTDDTVLCDLKLPQDRVMTLEKVLTKPYYALHTVLCVRRAMGIMTWKDLITQMEQVGDVPEVMLTQVIHEFDRVAGLKKEVLHNSDGHPCEVTILAQALAAHEGDDRKTITEQDVHDPVTLRELIVDVRMGVYEERCQAKHAEWLKSIGDITFATAATCDIAVFENMIGSHTHGHSHDVFWALAKACAGDDEKKEVFKARSNQAVKANFSKLLARAQQPHK